MSKEQGFSSWLEMNKGAIGPPIAHAVAAVGMLLAAGLAYVLASMGYLSKPWGVVLILAGYAIPFAIARDRAGRRRR